MKRIKKLVFVLAAVLILVLAAPVQAKAATNKIDFTPAASSITVNWTKPTLSSGYTLTSYAIYDETSGGFLATGISPSSTSYTVTGLSTGYIAYWDIYYYYNTSYSTNNPGYVAYGRVNTRPKTLSSSNFNVTYYYTNTNKVYLRSSFVTGATGYQYEFTNLKTGKTKYYKTTYTATTIDIPVDTAYKYRARAYYTNSSTQKTYYGSWSKVYKAFDNASISGKSYSNKSGFTLTLKKATGVTKYKVYVSKGDDDHYKFTQDIKVTGTSKTTTITKCGSSKLVKSTTYYIRVVPIISTGGTTYTSTAKPEGHIYVYKA